MTDDSIFIQHQLIGKRILYVIILTRYFFVGKAIVKTLPDSLKRGPVFQRWNK
jgi:hypothetical protein